MTQTEKKVIIEKLNKLINKLPDEREVYFKFYDGKKDIKLSWNRNTIRSIISTIERDIWPDSHKAWLLRCNELWKLLNKK